MDQIKLVINDASDKVTNVAHDMSKTLENVTSTKKNQTNSDTTSTNASSDSLISTCPNLTKKQRMTGFGSCFVLGFFINFGSTFALILGADNGTKFGITYTVGNIISLCSSGFLVGPQQQLKLMLKPVRRIATLLYLVMIIVVMIVALVTPQFGLIVLFLVLIQCIAAIWYSASYIPYGRKILASIAKNVCGTAL
ncbi:unnamed protein product [Peronospora belbahrii]|uniref:Vesicle transport protein n=1 Tax=Peronospora belbahrii TaxID=622444 RepID=A0AAU9L165_9STRA|nr:unnamed protein product [Peronospora belbahrii]CAH0516106.1 unnamed protein product [Peronospora belbahrii]